MDEELNALQEYLDALKKLNDANAEIDDAFMVYCDRLWNCLTEKEQAEARRYSESLILTN